MNKVWHLADMDRLELQTRLPAALTEGAVVVFLCAQWCGTCKTFAADAQALAQAFPQALFLWLDVEDDSAVVGDVDVDNFPSLAVFVRGVPVHFGVTMPQRGVVGRLLKALLATSADAPHAADVEPEVSALPQELLAWCTP